MAQHLFGDTFGPLQFIAAAMVMLQYINQLREDQGVPPLTWEEIETEVKARELLLDPDDWISPNH